MPVLDQAPFRPRILEGRAAQSLDEIGRNRRGVHQDAADTDGRAGVGSGRAAAKLVESSGRSRRIVCSISKSETGGLLKVSISRDGIAEVLVELRLRRGWPAT